MSDLTNTIVLYGCPPKVERMPDVQPVAPPWVPAITIPQALDPLVPCPKCARHIRGTECPFCFAEAIAKAPSRKALEDADAALMAALSAIDDARAKTANALLALRAELGKGGER
jgi:hypothetical protein